MCCTVTILKIHGIQSYDSTVTPERKMHIYGCRANSKIGMSHDCLFLLAPDT